MKRRIHISNALQVLEESSLSILTVTEWAGAMGYSRSHFCRQFTKEFGLNPKEYLKDFRLRLIKQEIKKDPEVIGYCIAVNCGFSNEKALHKYLSFNLIYLYRHLNRKFNKKAQIGYLFCLNANPLIINYLRLLIE